MQNIKHMELLWIFLKSKVSSGAAEKASVEWMEFGLVDTANFVPIIGSPCLPYRYNSDFI